MPDFWSDVRTSFTSEADVELCLVIPLLHALGYQTQDVAPKYPVEFQEGRVGRKPEADFVCLYTCDASLVVVEAKKPGEALPDGKLQGESYAYACRKLNPVSWSREPDDPAVIAGSCQANCWSGLGPVSVSSRA